MSQAEEPARKGVPDQDEIETRAEQLARARPDEVPRDAPAGPPGSAAGGIHAAGTPGGGSAAGGLAGSNTPEGTPDADELDEALGSGPLDSPGDRSESEPPYAGPSGGAVGGAPAEKRASGGHTHRGVAPGGPQRGDSTIGSDPSPRPDRP